MTIKRKSILLLLQLAAVYCLTACASVFLPERFLLRHFPTILLGTFSFFLMRYFSDHIIEPDTRRYLVGIAALIIFWVLLRAAKYIAFEETGIIARHLWYFYYVPLLLIPLFSLFAALSTVRHGDGAGPAWQKNAAALLTLFLILIVLTNDLHQRVFRFREGFADWDASYTHEPLYYVICVWIVLLLLAVFRILFTECRVLASRRLVWIPLLPAGFGILYTMLYLADLWPRVNGGLFGEFPEAVGITMAGIWLSLIYIGLIPSNVGYADLFALSGLSAQIADHDFQIIYKSPGAASLTEEELRSDRDIYPDADIRIHRKEVQGGYVYWQRPSFSGWKMS